MFPVETVWIILTGALVAGSCALLGSFLVLRKLAMLGDAISHAVLPGIVIAYLFTGSRGSLVMFVGAVVFGLLTTFLVQFLAERGIQGDSAIGVAFTFLFAVGVMLVSVYGEAVDLDLDCVLYGDIAYTPFDTYTIGGVDIGPRALWISGGLFLVNTVLIGLFYKPLKISAFDPAMATAVGISVPAMHYLLMMLVSVTTVGAFESVGAILVVGMLIVPPATAYLLTDKLSHMLYIAVGIGVLSSILGFFAAIAIDASIAGAIATVAGLFFGAAFFLSPSHGVLSKYLSRLKLGRQVLEEDVLLATWRWIEEKAHPVVSVADLLAGVSAPAGRIRKTFSSLVKEKMITLGKGGISLTEAGNSRAVALIRRHRLFENYLDTVGYATDHIHAPADRVEHYIDDEMMTQVESAVGDRETDPQNKLIPERRTDMG